MSCLPAQQLRAVKYVPDMHAHMPTIRLCDIELLPTYLPRYLCLYVSIPHNTTQHPAPLHDESPFRSHNASPGLNKAKQSKAMPDRQTQEHSYACMKAFSYPEICRRKRFLVRERSGLGRDRPASLPTATILYYTILYCAN